jgi:hypothetical protein
MIESCTSSGEEIIFSDSILERAEILRLCIDMAYSKPLDIDSMKCFDGLDLISLLEKYDFSTPLQLVRLQIARDTGDIEVITAHHLFYYACALKEVHHAHRLLPFAAKCNWAALDSGSDSLQVGVEGLSVLSPNAMGTKWMDQ